MHCSLSLQKFREYLEGSNLITKLQAKHDLLQRTLGEGKWFKVKMFTMQRYIDLETKIVWTVHFLGMPV